MLRRKSEIFHFPFAVITGEGTFTLTDDERKNLKLYLEKGGFLLASAGCSSKEWGDSFTHEIETIFPDRKLAEVPMDHPIFRTVFEVQRLDMSHGGVRELTNYATESSQIDGASPRLFPRGSDGANQLIPTAD